MGGRLSAKPSSAAPGAAPIAEPICYRGTSLTSNSAPLGPYSRTMPRDIWWPHVLPLYQIGCSETSVVLAPGCSSLAVLLKACNLHQAGWSQG